MASQYNGEKLHLKFLFTAHYKDGTKFTQTQDDTSASIPGKSAFADVDQTKLAAFELNEVGGLRRSYKVDLTDGHFEVNGYKFEAHDQFVIPEDLRLIYFRETKIDTIIGGDGHDEVFFINRYFIGWQFTKDGKNYQQTIAIK